MQALGRQRHVIAPDTLGNGDSCLPAPGAALDIAYFADAHLRALGALGIDRFDAYGSHTGGNIAAEVSIRAPDRVAALILDGIAVYAQDEQADMLAHYAPEIAVDHIGSQLNWAWHFVRDNALFWPWFKRDAAHVRKVGLPSPETLHEKVVEVLKAVRSYHHSYRAAFAYDKRARLPLVRVRTLLACAQDDMLLEYHDTAAALMPSARQLVTPGIATPERAEATAAVLLDFLDQG
jgi:pimeloyl-ACP methyl ester carboxylesterase